MNKQFINFNLIEFDQIKTEHSKNISNSMDKKVNTISIVSKQWRKFQTTENNIKLHYLESIKNLEKISIKE